MATAHLDHKRGQLRAQLAVALQEDEDPLAAYDNLVKWTIDNYQGKLISRSGLLELLEEATGQFKDDSAYQGDLRYLKLWILYASHVEDPSGVYLFILKKGIGTAYAQVYEECAIAFASCGRPIDAEKAFQLGIQRRARPLERLKKRYTEFQSTGLPLQVAALKAKAALWSDATPETQSLRKNPLKSHSPHLSKPAPQKAPPPSTSSSSVPGRRVEKHMFNLFLLSNEGGEFCIQEARARSMGLLGKKWGPPPKTVPVDFNDDGVKDTRGAVSKFAGAEPTVTIATKEALADVFGMYNSPDKTLKVGAMTGTKHAPIRRVDPITPMSLQSSFRALQKENSEIMGKTPTATFKPFVDENAFRKENNTPAPPPKLKPFVDESSSKLSAVTPEPGRRALSVKETGTVLPPKENDVRPKTPNLPRAPEAQHSVFTPASGPSANRSLSRQDIFTNDPPAAPGGVFRASTDLSAPLKLAPFVDAEQQSRKVFSRPPSSASENAPVNHVARAALHPANASRQPFVPVRSALAQRPVSQSYSSSSSEDIQENVVEPQEDYYEGSSTTESDDLDAGFEVGQEDEREEDPSVFEDEEDYPAPLGGRLGHVNVMTPITERTFEYTSTTRNAGTPNDMGRTFSHYDAIDTAERLAAEVRQENDGYVGEDDVMDDVEERTGTLNLTQALTAASKFNPPNPCNPFDPSIMSTMLSLIPADPTFHDLRQQESGQLDSLQKFAKKKSRRGSSSVSIEDSLQLDLGDFSYGVVGKLGEGGFGAVFEAIDIRATEDQRRGHGDEDSYDEDEEDLPRVALKVVKPRNMWEFRVLRRVHQTLSAQLRQSIIVPSSLYVYRDESFLVMEYCNQGTLLDIVNNAPKVGITQQGACLDELLVVFFTIELMRLLEGMHQAGFIHGDVKIDNCLLRLEDVPGPATAWTSVYQPSGEGGWCYKGIKMIDFGRTIDTRFFPAKQQYVGDWPTDARDCLEMREDKPWTHQTDYFGLAGIIYCMLYGKYIEASSVVLAPSSQGGQQRYKLSAPFKRYWQVDLWMRLFDLLLNSGSVRPDRHLPLCEEMAALRKEMETWLQANCNRGSNSLKGLLKKIGLSLLQG